jgi:hypothetical protein
MAKSNISGFRRIQPNGAGGFVSAAEISRVQDSIEQQASDITSAVDQRRPSITHNQNLFTTGNTSTKTVQAVLNGSLRIDPGVLVSGSDFKVIAPKNPEPDDAFTIYNPTLSSGSIQIRSVDEREFVGPISAARSDKVTLSGPGMTVSFRWNGQEWFSESYHVP